MRQTGSRRTDPETGIRVYSAGLCCNSEIPLKALLQLCLFSV